MANYTNKKPVAKAEEKKSVGKVISGKASIRKKSEGRKILEMVFPSAGSDLKHTLMSDVVVPMIKSGLWEAFNRVLYPNGDGPRRSGGYSGSWGGGTRINYAGFSRPESRERYIPAGSAVGFDYDRIAFETRGDAEAVLVALDEIIDQYQFATVGAFYEAAGVTTNNPQVEKFCWRSLGGARPIQVSDGWIIRMPRPIPLD